MKKDPNIEKMLHEQIQSEEIPDMDLLLPAIQEMRRKNSEKAASGSFAPQQKATRTKQGGGAVATRKRTAVTVLLIALAAVVLAVVIAVVSFNVWQNHGILSVDSLQSTTSVSQSEKDLFPNITHSSGVDVAPSYMAYTLEGEVVAVEYKARRQLAGRVEDVTIIAEVGEYKLEEYREYTKNSTYKHTGVSYNYKTYYENGEYCSEYYVEGESARYYITVMCPDAVDRNYYISAIINIL